jgi:hypothetical protein
VAGSQYEFFRTHFGAGQTREVLPEVVNQVSLYSGIWFG